MIPTIEAIDQSGKVSGWTYLWLKYVSGFSASNHCARCLVGPYSKRVHRTDMPANVQRPLDEAAGWRHLYLCGVASRGGWAANLHLVCEAAPGEVAEAEASTGTIFRITNARRLAIPPLAPGFGGKSKSFTTCRNWQFGVEYYPPGQIEAAPHPMPRASGLLEQLSGRRAR